MGFVQSCQGDAVQGLPIPGKGAVFRNGRQLPRQPQTVLPQIPVHIPGGGVDEVAGEQGGDADGGGQGEKQDAGTDAPILEHVNRL